MIKKIKRGALKKRMDSCGFVVVNVLSKDKYEKEHILGSINLPLDDDFETNAVKVLKDKNQEIIVHCSSFECQASTNAAKKLEGLGYKRVVDFKGGINDWKDAGYSLERASEEDECIG